MCSRFWAEDFPLLARVFVIVVAFTPKILMNIHSHFTKQS